ncbi:DivIVA domain-containing protein [Janibacter hoylei]|uniref:DivIVA domain-containing protein n=1 Tax=Janibacter hoylei TaxID=364298 RepID=UPI002238A358|nr:DivIVA domain-containing protein [Janibacter hoylei]MCW4602456.1 DivIVA domain-containing protein [Janibacter hoylei]
MDPLRPRRGLRRRRPRRRRHRSPDARPHGRARRLHPHHGLPEGAWAADDIDLVRFDTALRGYRMDQVDEVLDRLQQRIAELEMDRPGRGERRDDDPGLD